jgi:hypothetical protein
METPFFLNFKLAPGIEKFQIKFDEIKTLEENPYLLCLVLLATNPRISKSVQKKLAKHEWCVVRASLATNENLDRSLFSKLAQDPDERVREIIAAREDTSYSFWIRKKFLDLFKHLLSSFRSISLHFPERVLEELSQDEVEDVRRIVGLRMDLPKSIWKRMLRDEGIGEIKEIIIQNYDLDKNDIKEVLKKGDIYSILAVCMTQKIDAELFNYIDSLKDNPKIFKELLREVKEQGYKKLILST